MGFYRGLGAQGWGGDAAVLLTLRCHFIVPSLCWFQCFAVWSLFPSFLPAFPLGSSGAARCQPGRRSPASWLAPGSHREQPPRAAAGLEVERTGFASAARIPRAAPTDRVGWEAAACAGNGGSAASCPVVLGKRDDAARTEMAQGTEGGSAVAPRRSLRGRMAPSGRSGVTR